MSEVTDNPAAMSADLVAEAVQAEHTRIFGVLELPEAQAHTQTAIQLAKQGMSAEGAKAILATMPAAIVAELDVHAVALEAMADTVTLEMDAPATKAAPLKNPILI